MVALELEGHQVGQLGERGHQGVESLVAQLVVAQRDRLERREVAVLRHLHQRLDVRVAQQLRAEADLTRRLGARSPNDCMTVRVDHRVLEAADLVAVLFDGHLAVGRHVLEEVAVEFQVLELAEHPVGRRRVQPDVAADHLGVEREDEKFLRAPRALAVHRELLRVEGHHLGVRRRDQHRGAVGRVVDETLDAERLDAAVVLVDAEK